MGRMTSPPNSSMARSTDLIKSVIRVMILVTEILTDFEMVHLPDEIVGGK